MKRFWVFINNRENRPVTVYFLLIFFIAAFLMYNRLGYLSLLWSLLAVVFFAIPIPAPMFAWRYLSNRGMQDQLRLLWGAYLLSYVLSVGVLWYWAGDIGTALFMGFLYYGYPGTLFLFLALRLSRSRSH